MTVTVHIRIARIERARIGQKTMVYTEFPEHDGAHKQNGDGQQVAYELAAGHCLGEEGHDSEQDEIPGDEYETLDIEQHLQAEVSLDDLDNHRGEDAGEYECTRHDGEGQQLGPHVDPRRRGQSVYNPVQPEGMLLPGELAAIEYDGDSEKESHTDRDRVEHLPGDGVCWCSTVFADHKSGGHDNQQAHDEEYDEWSALECGGGLQPRPVEQLTDAAPEGEVMCGRRQGPARPNGGLT